MIVVPANASVYVLYTEFCLVILGHKMHINTAVCQEVCSRILLKYGLIVEVLRKSTVV